MKRITGAFLVFVGLAGCLSPAVPSCQKDKKPAPEADPAPVAAPPPAATPPSNPKPTQRAKHVAARPPGPKALPPGASLPTPVSADTITPPTEPLSPAALTQAVTAGAQPIPPVAAPAVPTTSAVKGPPPLPPGMPMAATPPRTAGKSPAPVQQVSHVPMPGQPDPVVPEEAGPPPPPPASPPAPSEPPVPEPGKAGSPLVRLVNTKRITLNFKVKNVGLSGLSSVELWYTQDCKEWKKYDAPMQAQAYVVEVDEEGMYGFTLRAKSGLGLGKEPPKAGDQPQVWVIVDLSKPDVELQDVAVSVADKVQQVAIKWKATDKNLARQPIALSYAEKEDGPWSVIAASVENNGEYLWSVPADVPAKFLVRVEALDLAGNLGRAQTKEPVLLDMMKPEATITNIEANPGK